MPNDDLKKRIEALNKRPLDNVPEVANEDAFVRALRKKFAKQGTGYRGQVTEGKGYPSPRPSPARGEGEGVPEAVVYSRSAPQVTARPAFVTPSMPKDFGPAVALEDAVDGIVTEAPAGPGYYLIELPARELEADATYMHRRFCSLTGHPDGQAVERICHACKTERIAPEEVLFLDLETTGLAMTPVFLVGTMECTEDGFAFRQYFARDYSEEVSIVSAISERLKSAKMLVTFNGRTFDVPFLRNRAVATGVRFHDPETHLDLLYEARKVYRRELPNCRLQTLEQMVCGRGREEDIPGAEIPAAYHDYVRTGNANKIQFILQHNLHDLLTMADLMNRMWLGE